MSENSGLLSMCCVCKAIKVSDGMWLKEEQNPKLYRRFVEKYEKPDGKGIPRISHGYCPPCGEQWLKEAEEWKNDR